MSGEVMGITSIHILTDPDNNLGQETQILATIQQKLINEHRRGEHPWGSMHRDCPLCQVLREKDDGA
jgi:hypothetical protein